MKKAGIILIILQVISLIGGITKASATGQSMFSGGPGMLFEIIGYCIFGIIGVILLIKDYNKKNRTKNNSNIKANEVNKENANNNQQNNQNDKLTDCKPELNNMQEQKDAENEPNNCLLPEKVTEKYTRMFKRSFDNIQSKEIFMLNNYKCVLYKFATLAKPLVTTPFLNIGGFCYFIKAKKDKIRFFASEYSFDNTYVLCEWVFEDEKETKHINYGKVVSSNIDMGNHISNIKQKLKEILT